MYLLKTASCLALLSALTLTGPNSARAADLLYNFNFELKNPAGVDLLADGTFSADPTMAVTGLPSGPLGESSSAAIDSLAVTIFSLGTAPFTDSSFNLSASNATHPPLAWFSPADLALGEADPALTLSAPDSAGFLTASISGASVAFYQSATAGSTTGTPFISGPGVVATSFDASVPEPASLGLLSVALVCGAFLLRRKLF